MTTQKGIRHAVQTLHCRYRNYNIPLNRKHLNAQFYTDHLQTKTKSLEGNVGSWIYTTKNFTVAYPCKNRSELGYTLERFADDVVIPDVFKSDLAPEIIGKHTEFQAQIKRLHIDLAHL